MKRLLTGNFLLILCCVFYLAWWILAFKPAGAVKGLRSGWLLIPAAAFGVGAVVMICRGVNSAPKEAMLFPAIRIVGIGAVLYLALLIGTYLVLKRPVTTELFLIVGWAVLAVVQISALYGMGAYGKTAASAWILCVVLMAAVSLFCYLIYYRLDSGKGYYDGMLPLILVAAVSVLMNGSILYAG